MSSYLNGSNKMLILAGISVVPLAFASVLTYRYIKSEKTGVKAEEDNDNDDISFVKSDSFYEIGDSSKDIDLSSISESWITSGLEQPLVIAMVGLPARGKSYLVKMILRYLKWTGFESKVFNVGSYRRQIGLASANSDFFNAENQDGQKVREEMAMAVQEVMYKWLHETDEMKRRVAIFDATNTTANRRLALTHRAQSEGVFLLFVESICDDQEVLDRNYNLKLQNDDYKNMEPMEAKRDFLSRVHAYEKVYETIEDWEFNNQIAYIKLINVGQKVITRNCHGYLPSQVAFYLQNVHIQPRKIFLSLVAENQEHLYGSERLAGTESGKLTESGIRFSQELVGFIKQEQRSNLSELGREVILLTGTSKVHYETIRPLVEAGYSAFFTPLLNELRGGDLQGLSKKEIEELYPLEHNKRLKDKLHYRYPGVGGESYLDVIERIRPVIIELERQRKSIILVCHLAVLRCVYAYFTGVPLQDIPFKDFKFHHIYELSPGPFGCACSIIEPKSENTSDFSTKSVD